MANLQIRLRELRKQSDYSQLDLATRLGVSKQTISQYERGVREPDYDNLLALCDIFNVSADYLLGKADVTLRLLTTEELERLNNSSIITPDESAFLAGYRSLNADGRQEARSHMDYLCSQERYKKDIELSEDLGSA